MDSRVKECEEKLAQLTAQVEQFASQHTQEYVNTVVKRSLISVLNDLNKTKLIASHNAFSSGRTRLKWVFPDYKASLQLEKEGTVFWHESPVFTTHENGYHLQLSVKFFATLSDGETYVAAAMQLVRGDHDATLAWPAAGIQFTFVIEGPQGKKCSKLTDTQDEQPLEFAAIRRPRAMKNPPFWREGKIIKRSQLESEYVQNNVLTIRVEVDVGSQHKLCGNRDIMGTVYDGKLEVLQESPCSILLRSTILPTTPFQPVCFRYSHALNFTANYFELEIMSIAMESGSIGIGIGGNSYDGQPQMPGWQSQSYGYHSDDGQLFEGMGRGKKFGPVCCPGDIIGCGLHFPTSAGDVEIEHNADGETGTDLEMSVQVFFTHNGMRIGSPLDVRVHPKHCFPLVGLIHRPTAARFFPPYFRPMNDFQRMF